MDASDPQRHARVALIVPTLNEAVRIQGAVERACLLADEVIVVDGGSRDGTPELAASAGARVLRSRPGRAIQMNVGAASTSADVLWFVHADARLPPDARRALNAALADPTVVGGAFVTRTVCDRGTSRLRPVLPMADLRSTYTRHPYGDQALFVRRSAFDRVGGYPPQPLLEDLELARRLWTIGKLVRCPQRVEVSARRFLARPLYYSAVMNVFPVFYRVGVSADRLARWYGHPR